jgi:hypothetical protein
MARVREVIDQALGLPLKQRAQVALELIASLETEPLDNPAEVERAWQTEISRRLRTIDAGTAELVPWSVAEREIEADLAKLRRARKPRRKRAR